MLLHLWCATEAQPCSRAVKVTESTSLLVLPQSFYPLLQYIELWFGCILWREGTVDRFGVVVFEEGNFQETLILDKAAGN